MIFNETFLILISSIALSVVLGIILYLLCRTVIETIEYNKKRNRKEEASIIYNRRKRGFDYHNDKEGWKKWKYMNEEICNLFEGTYY